MSELTGLSGLCGSGFLSGTQGATQEQLQTYYADGMRCGCFWKSPPLKLVLSIESEEERFRKAKRVN